MLVEARDNQKIREKSASEQTSHVEQPDPEEEKEKVVWLTYRCVPTGSTDDDPQSHLFKLKKKGGLIPLKADCPIPDHSGSRGSIISSR